MGKIQLKKTYKAGEQSIEGEIEIADSNMGVMVDAGELCSPENKIGFGLAIVAVMINVPYNQLKQMDPMEFMQLKDELGDMLPN